MCADGGTVAEGAGGAAMLTLAVAKVSPNLPRAGDQAADALRLRRRPPTQDFGSRVIMAPVDLDRFRKVHRGIVAPSPKTHLRHAAEQPSCLGLCNTAIAV